MSDEDEVRKQVRLVESLFARIDEKIAALDRCEDLLSLLGIEYDELGRLPVPRILNAAAALCMRRHIEAAEKRYERGEHASLIPPPDEETTIPLWLLEGLARHLIETTTMEVPGSEQKHLGMHEERWIRVLFLRARGHKFEAACAEVGASSTPAVSMDAVMKSYRLMEENVRTRRQHFILQSPKTK